MKKLQRLLPIAVCIILLLSGCGDTENTVIPYNEGVTSGIGTDVIAENSRFELSWNDENKCVLFKNTQENTVWSTIPYKYMLSGGKSANVTSPVNITVSDTDTLNVTEVKGSSGAVSDGRVIAEKTEKGMKVTYYFDNYKISVPILYELDDDSFIISLESNGIREASHYKLLDVEIAPFLCAAENSAENYLFIPSNSGALMYTQSDTGGTRKYCGAVYGTDAAHMFPTPFNYESEIKMPVFGVKNGDNALFAVIENGDEHTSIVAEAGNDRTKWSAVWPKITVRGVDVVETSLPQSRMADISYVSEERIVDNVMVRYIPLYGENADYNGMARCYREYLTKNKLLNTEKSTGAPYSITMYGGAQINKLFMGIPYKKTISLTSFKETYEIINELIESVGVVPEVQLIGYGKSGINIGKVGGGFGFAKNLGSEEDLKILLKFFSEKDIAYYFDSEIIRYNTSSLGFFSGSDIAKTAADSRAVLNTVDVALAGFNDEEYNLLSRQKLSTAAEKLIKASNKKGIKGISLSSLSNISYSDYSDSATAAKGNFRSQVTEIVQNIKNSGLAFAANAPNIYAALGADSIFNFTESAQYNALNQTIPFYQMVLSGSKSMYSNAVNTANEPKKQIMLSAAYGLGLNFKCIGGYNVDIDLNGYDFYGAVFEKQKDVISSYANEYLNTFSEIQGAVIEEYHMLNSQISMTVYNNGVIIYANHTNATASFGDIELSAYEYKVIRK